MEGRSYGVLSIVSAVVGIIFSPLLLGPLSLMLGVFAYRGNAKYIGIIGIVLGSNITLLGLHVVHLILGTSMPLAVYQSGSMAHDGSFDDWWDSRAICSFGNCKQSDWYLEQNINKEQFEQFTSSNGINRGDLLVFKSANTIEIGDVIAYTTDHPYPFVHRVIGINDGTYETKGDRNPTQAPKEKGISEDQIIGKVVGRIPMLGYSKIIIFDKLFGWL